MRIAPFLFLLILPILTFSISLSTDKTQYLKGEIIKITGTAQTGELVELRITNGPRELFKDRQVAVNDSFLFSYPIPFSDPKGAWYITASSHSGNSTLRVDVSPTREGAYYLVRFTSPAYENIEDLRTDSIPVSISIFDSRIPVSGAIVKAWGGEKPFTISEISPGIYQGNYEIPFDSPVGGMEIYVIVVKREKEGVSFGGENSIRIQVKEVPVQVELLSPSADTYKMGEKITVKFRISYSTGKPVINPKLTVKANDETLQISNDGEFFIGEYTISEHDASILKSGTVTISVDVEDSAGNKGSAHKVVEVQGFTVQTITEYYWYIVLGGVLLLLLFIFVIRAIIARSSLEKLEKEREELIALEKGLQEDYIKKGTIDRANYERRMAEYESRLSELDSKIKKKKGKK